MIVSIRFSFLTILLLTSYFFLSFRLTRSGITISPGAVTAKSFSCDFELLTFLKINREICSTRNWRIKIPLRYLRNINEAKVFERRSHTVNLITIYCCLHIRSINFYIALNCHILPSHRFLVSSTTHLCLGRPICSRHAKPGKNGGNGSETSERKGLNLFSILTQKLDQFRAISYWNVGQKGFSVEGWAL